MIDDQDISLFTGSCYGIVGFAMVFFTVIINGIFTRNMPNHNGDNIGYNKRVCACMIYEYTYIYIYT